jgi:hypothetical protein
MHLETFSIFLNKECYISISDSTTIHIVNFSPLFQFWTAVLPLDVAKTIIQTTPDKSSTRNPFQILSSVSCPDFLNFIIVINGSLLVSSPFTKRKTRKRGEPFFFWLFFPSFLPYWGLEEREAECVFFCRFTGGLELKDAIQVWVLP